METRHLRYFLAVAATQHMTRAALQVNVTQSTLSHQIRQLEELLGTVLFDRVGRGIRLTQAGEVFRGFAQRALKEIEDGAMALSELDKLLRGHLRIGVIHTFNSTLIPPVLSKFVTAYPDVHVTAEEMTALKTEESIMEGDIDLGIAFAPCIHEEIESEPLFDEELVLITRKDKLARAGKAMHASGLAELKLALLTRRYMTRRLIDEAFGQYVGANVILEMNSIDALLNTVRTGALSTVLSDRAIGNDHELTKTRIIRPTVVRTAALLWHKERYRTAAAREFARMFKAALPVRKPRA
ncbi:MAG: LysR family transcriptional regulator, cyn operon transcriptional activator [Burkholderiales bacterium]